MKETDRVDNGGAGWGLVAGGVIALLWSLGYFVWSLVNLLWGGAMLMGSLAAVMDSGDPMQVVFGVVSVISPIIQLLAYLITAILAVLTIVAGVRFNAFRSYGLVKLGAVACVGGPVVGLLASLTSFCNISTGLCCCVGFVLGNIPTLIVTVICLAVTIYAFVVLKRPEVAAAFAVNDAQE